MKFGSLGEATGKSYEIFDTVKISSALERTAARHGEPVGGDAPQKPERSSRTPQRRTQKKKDREEEAKRCREKSGDVDEQTAQQIDRGRRDRRKIHDRVATQGIHGNYLILMLVRVSPL